MRALARAMGCYWYDFLRKWGGEEEGRWWRESKERGRRRGRGRLRFGLLEIRLGWGRETLCIMMAL